MNPFKTVYVYNELDACYCEMRLVRWRLWLLQLFGDDYQRHWVENARRNRI